jgi:hypothetical protein
MTRVSRTGGTEVWSKSLPVDLTWTDAVTPLVRKTCCTPPYITDNVYVNLYQLSPANAPMLAASYRSASLLGEVVYIVMVLHRGGLLYG